jgi:hypothetical protein
LKNNFLDKKNINLDFFTFTIAGILTNKRTHHLNFVSRKNLGNPNCKKKKKKKKKPKKKNPPGPQTSGVK